jgi:hypothetical protein
MGKPARDCAATDDQTRGRALAYTITKHLDVDVPPDVAFDTLADHDSWPEWMPPSFKPVGPSLGTLREGIAPRVRIAGAPFDTALSVKVVERPRRILWAGGTPSLAGSHEFTFEATASGTRVTSIETWSGWLAWFLFPMLYPGAHRVGRAQLLGIQKGASARLNRRANSASEAIGEGPPG